MNIEKHARKFDPDREILLRINQTGLQLQKVREDFPFKTNPSSIDALTSEKLHHPPNKPDYFFYWVEHGLKPLGKITVGSIAPWKNACKKIEVFKQLLHSAMDPNLSLPEKIDLKWEEISFFGGEKLIAKKIISMYHDEVLPIFKTEHLEGIYDKLVGNDNLPQGYRKLSLGQKFQLLSSELLKVKYSNEVTKSWHPVYFMRFLYRYYPPWREFRQQKPVDIQKLRALDLYRIPANEQEVVFLFAKLHEKLGVSTITKVQTKYPDVHAIDEKGNALKIELELLASNFLDHDHNPSGCDWVVCWEDNLGKEWPHKSIQVKQLRDFV